ncbi:hypothetical protein BD779DRAFT_1557773 [Infundibulicybe gibba]|nr:hypothetical protein BD779DRAFT_1557773 [Infundibulicybe gibba]
MDLAKPPIGGLQSLLIHRSLLPWLRRGPYQHFYGERPRPAIFHPPPYQIAI